MNVMTTYESGRIVIGPGLGIAKSWKKFQAIIFTSIDCFSGDKASSIAEYPGKTPFI